MDKPKCTAEKPRCTACVQAQGKRNKVIFVTDLDEESQRLREGGKLLAANVRRTREYR